jgi:choline kinase
MSGAQVHVVVLAAGRGSRLGALGESRPKWLLDVDGRTVADRQLQGIGAAGPAVASTSVVIGHAGDAIERYLSRRAPHVGIVANPEYLELNNWWSVLLGLRQLPAEETVVIINGDLLIEPEQLRAFIADAASGTQHGMLAVDLEQGLTDESMKISRRPDGTLDEVGKTGIARPAGEFVGLSMARGAALRAFRAALERFVDDPAHRNEWYEGAIGRTARAGADWHVWPVRTGTWVEIDDARDLDLAVAIETRS